MQKIVLDMQNSLYANSIRLVLIQEMDELEVVLSDSPSSTSECCRQEHADVVLMEVTGYRPWMLEQRLDTCAEIKAHSPACKRVLLVDEVADRALAEQVKQAKVDGLIDMFVYGSVSAKYLTALIETV